MARPSLSARISLPVSGSQTSIEPPAPVVATVPSGSATRPVVSERPVSHEATSFPSLPERSSIVPLSALANAITSRLWSQLSIVPALGIMSCTRDATTERCRASTASGTTSPSVCFVALTACSARRIDLCGSMDRFASDAAANSRANVTRPWRASLACWLTANAVSVDATTVAIANTATRARRRVLERCSVRASCATRTRSRSRSRSRRAMLADTYSRSRAVSAMLAVVLQASV